MPWLYVHCKAEKNDSVQASCPLRHRPAAPKVTVYGILVPASDDGTRAEIGFRSLHDTFTRRKRMRKIVGVPSVRFPGNGDPPGFGSRETQRSATAIISEALGR